MQLLRLIRCEARRLLRNPAFFVLLIWGIWIVKDVCNPNMYGTYGTSDLGGVGKQIGFFANILDKTDPAGSAIRTALFMTYEWFFVLVGCIVISCAMDYQSRSSEVTYAKGTGVAKAVVAKWLVLTIATSTAFSLFSGFTLFNSPLGCYVDGQVFLNRYLPVLLLIDAIFAALVAQSMAVFYLLRNAPLSIMLVLVGTLLASDEYTLVVFSNHASTQIPWWLSVGPYLRHLGNLCFQGLAINQIILFSVICIVVSLQLGVMGIKARRGVEMRCEDMIKAEAYRVMKSKAPLLLIAAGFVLALLYSVSYEPWRAYGTSDWLGDGVMGFFPNPQYGFGGIPAELVKDGARFLSAVAPLAHSLFFPIVAVLVIGYAFRTPITGSQWLVSYARGMKTVQLLVARTLVSIVTLVGGFVFFSILVGAVQSASGIGMTMDMIGEFLLRLSLAALICATLCLLLVLATSLFGNGAFVLSFIILLLYLGYGNPNMPLHLTWLATLASPRPIQFIVPGTLLFVALATVVPIVILGLCWAIKGAIRKRSI